MSTAIPVLGESFNQLSLADADGHDDIDQFLFDDYEVANSETAATTVDIEHIKKDLENEFLSPPQSFSSEWLDRFQQYVIPVFTQHLVRC